MKQRRKIRPLLLVLLWVWAGLVFLVIDLFFDAPALERVRPDAEIYRATRYAAHKMVGEPYVESDEFSAMPRPAARHAAPPAVRNESPVRAPVAPLDERERLIYETLEEQVRALSVERPDYRAARVALERLAYTAPDYATIAELPLASIRQCCAYGLASDDPDIVAEAVRLAEVNGDEMLAYTCLQMLTDEQPTTREEALIRKHAARAVERWGSDQDHAALHAWEAKRPPGRAYPARKGS